MWWKVYFWITVGELVLQVLGLFVNPGVRIAIQIVMLLIFAIAVAGMYSFAFQKKLLTQVFWQYFMWIYGLLDLIYLIYAAAPRAPIISSLSFLQIYPNQGFIDVLIGVAIDIPLLYAMYHLTKEEPFAKPVEKKTKQEPYRWGMIQTALWGYSAVLIFYLFVMAFFPVQDATVHKNQVSDPLLVSATFAPLVLFWLWVVLRFKRYRWNWWRTTLAANGLLYSGIIFWNIFFPQADPTTQTTISGVDLIGLAQLAIMLLGLWIFGRTQFGKM